MTRLTPNPLRRGISLTEVLVALFVMAIGMLSLLTLFPLGAMQVGQALRDDRTSQLARQADAFLRQAWRNDIVGNPNTVEGYVWAMDDPYLVVKYPVSGGQTMRFVGSGVSPNSWYNNTAQLIAPMTVAGFGAPTAPPAPGNPPTPFTLTGEAVRAAPAGVPPTGPPVTSPYEVFVQPSNTNAALTANTSASYPVVFDPAGLNGRPITDPGRAWVGYSAGSTTPRLPRRTCQLVNPINPYTPGTNSTYPGTVTAFELTTLTDDMTFAPDGRPDPATMDLGRQGRYSYAAVVQRPSNGDRYVADLWVLVYDGRSVLPRAGDEVVVAPDATAVATSRSVTVTLPNRTDDTSPVLLRRGGWLIDGTIDSAAPYRRNFHAYRVSGYTELSVGATTTQYAVDLETPLVQALTDGTAGVPASQIYFLAALTEVFTRPKLRADVNY